MIRVLAIFSAAMFALSFQAAHAFPVDAGFINVRDFGAKGDGITDDTKAINAALTASGADTGPAFWQDQIVYFPRGTYLVSDIIAKRYASGNFASGAIMVGEGRDATIIKLADTAQGYANKNVPKAVLFTAAKLLDAAGATGGGKDYYGKGEGNDAFMNFIENMTIDTGSHAGAIAIDYLANNMGAVRNVTIRGNGWAGIALTRKWIGPALIQNVLIEGFDVGIDVDNTEYGITLDDVQLRNQRSIGLRNNHNIVSANQLAISGAPSPILNASADGLIVLVDSAHETIENHGAVDVRNITLADAPPPFIEPVEKWVSVTSFGAQKDVVIDSSEAIKKAFASDAATIYFPHGIYYINDNITVPASVKRIVGMTSTIRAMPARANSFTRDKGMLRIQNTSPLTIERIAFDNSWQGDQVAVEAMGTAPIILRDVVGAGVTTLKRNATAGEAFIENTCCGTMDFAGKNPIWARQLNSEGDGTRITNNGAPLTILGIKTEGMCTVIESKNNATTHVLGGLLYIARDKANPAIPAFKNTDSRFTASYGEESFNPDITYTVHVDDTKNGVNTLTKATDLPKRTIGRMVKGFAN